jgi:hypothetical protein
MSSNKQLSKRYFIRSKDRIRDTDTISNFHVNVGTSMTTKSIRLSLLTASIPTSWYTVQLNKNDTFYIEEIVTAAVVSRKLVFPEQNYTLTNFQSTLLSLLNTGSPAGYTYTVSFDINTGKVTISSGAGLFFTINGSFVASDNSAYKLIGLEKNVEPNGDLPDYITWSSETVVDLTYTPNIFISLNNVISDYYTSTNSSSSILACIPLTVNSFELQQYQNPVDPNLTSYLIPSYLFTNDINIQLLDSRGHTLNMLSNWNLELIAMYDDENY